MGTETYKAYIICINCKNNEIKIRIPKGTSVDDFIKK